MQIAWQFILDNECKIMRSEFGRITHEVNDMKLSIKGNADKGKSATTLPFSAIILPFSATTGLISSTLNGNPLTYGALKKSKLIKFVRIL